MFVKQNCCCRRFRRVLSMVIVLLTIGSLYLLPSVAVEVHAAETVTIPNPGDYFGGVDEITKGSSNTGYFCFGHSAYPQSNMNSYIKALKKLGLTGGTVEDDDGDKVAVMKWNGKEELWIRWDKGNKRMFINVSEPLVVAKATVKKEVNISVPDPQGYFGTFDYVSKGRDRTVYHCEDHSSYPQSKMDSYVKALKEAGLTGGTIAKQDNGDMLAMFDYDGKNCFSIRWRKKDQYIWFNVSEMITFVDDTRKESVNSDGPSVLALIEDCFGSHKSESYNKDQFTTVLVFRGSTTFPKAQFDKLKKYAESNGMKYFLHDFRKSKSMNVYHDVGGSLITGNYNKNTGEIKIEIKWEYIQKSGFFDQSEVPEDMRTPKTDDDSLDVLENCDACGGTGSCRECGGAGESKESIIGQPGRYSTKTCRVCSGLKKCSSCGGTGHK